MRLLRSGVVAAQLGQTALAATTAASTSLVVANGTWLVTAPVAGLNTSAKRVPVEAAAWPLIQWVSVGVAISIPFSCRHSRVGGNPDSVKLKQFFFKIYALSFMLA